MRQKDTQIHFMDTAGVREPYKMQLTVGDMVRKH